jgi:Flp pilus assembly pilin Flp
LSRERVPGRVHVIPRMACVRVKFSLLRAEYSGEPFTSTKDSEHDRMFYLRFLTMLLDERGQGLVEYAMILGLISCAAVAALAYLGYKTNTTLYGQIENGMNSVGQ